MKIISTKIFLGIEVFSYALSGQFLLTLYKELTLLYEGLTPIILLD
jgi:hypothetical protein